MSKPVSVLVVDDSPTVRATLRSQLEGAGHHVIEAATGEDALDQARQAGPDVVLLDLEMPGLGGTATLRVFCHDDQLSTIPVVIVSSHRDVGEIVAAMEQGAHDFLGKPFEAAELLARVRAAARVKALADELRRRNNDLEVFAQQASHDLKAPLSIVKGMAETLDTQGDAIDPALRHRLLDRITAAADRASAMVSDLLALARQGSPPEDDSPVTDLADVIAELTPPDRYPNADLHVSGTFAPVAVPRPEVVGILANLMDNASHYGRSADGQLRLDITGATDPPDQVILVRDDGPGISREDASMLFKPFYRGRSSLELNPSSTGIGLSIVARSAARHRGSVETSDAWPGACFVVRLPLADL